MWSPGRRPLPTCSPTCQIGSERETLIRHPLNRSAAFRLCCTQLAMAQSCGPLCAVASSSTQSSSSHDMPFRPSTLRVGPARYSAQFFGP